MKHFYIVVISLCLVTGAMAQWIPQNSGTNNYLISVHFTDDSTGCIVGGSGTILKTLNSGENWVLQNSGTTQGLSSFDYPDANTGYVIGGLKILKTTDGGTSWNNLPELPNFHFGSSVWFTDVNTGFIVGVYNDGLPPASGFIFKTIDGGMTWVDIPVSMPQHAVCFPNSNIGFSVGFGTIYKTTDGGLTWLLNLSPTEAFSSVYFTDTNTGHAVTDQGSIYKTIDGGTSWTNQSYVTPLASVYFPDPSTGYVVGNGGKILKTTDGGTTWLNQSSGTSNDLYSVFFTDTNTGYAVGDSGTIIKTTNGGYPLGINDKYSINALKIYPNPSSNKITIESTQQGTLKILNLNGNKLLQKEIGIKTATIDISELQKGIYLVKVVGDEGVYVGKIIKQ